MDKVTEILNQVSDEGIELNFISEFGFYLSYDILPENEAARAIELLSVLIDNEDFNELICILSGNEKVETLFNSIARELML